MIDNLRKLTTLIENLDFSKDNSKEINELINNSVKSQLMPFFYYQIPKGTVVLRARKNEDREKPFWFPQDISFRRDIYNIKEFQRATIPNQTSFYSTFGVSKNPITDTSMKVVMLEALPDLDSFDGIYTIGLWEFVEGLNCMTIIDTYYENCDNPVLNDVYSRYQDYLNDHPDTRVELERFNKVVSNEFKKTVRVYGEEKNHLMYQVSGTIGYMLQHHNFGVVYPTAKVSNYPHSLNVAIPWRFADSKLKIKYAGMFDVNVKNNVVSLSGIRECIPIESVINNPNSPKNEDMLCGIMEFQWREKESEEFTSYF